MRDDVCEQRCEGVEASSWELAVWFRRLSGQRANYIGEAISSMDRCRSGHVVDVCGVEGDEDSEAVNSEGVTG